MNMYVSVGSVAVLSFCAVGCAMQANDAPIDEARRRGGFALSLPALLCDAETVPVPNFVYVDEGALS